MVSYSNIVARHALYITKKITYQCLYQINKKENFIYSTKKMHLKINTVLVLL